MSQTTIDKENLDESPPTPQTVEEWLEWISSLEGDTFLDKADAANAEPFIRLLKDEQGMDAQEVGMVLHRFANRYLELGMEPPRKRKGDYRGYLEMINTYAIFGLPTTPEERDESQ